MALDRDMGSLPESCKLYPRANSPRYTRCDNLISGIATACRCGVESGKLMYLSMVGHGSADKVMVVCSEEKTRSLT
jgi:hypothetical protein